MFRIGIDEAGKGCAIGPLVVCVLGCTKEEEEELQKDIRICDSKKMSKQQRKDIFLQYSPLIRHEIIYIQPKDIDAAVSKNNLNYLEIDKTIFGIKSFQKKHGQITSIKSDCMGQYSIEKKYALEVQLNFPSASFSSEVRGESKHKIIALASIFAKENRDNYIVSLKESVEFGSGYPSDPRTKRFLLSNPGYIHRRFSWNLKIFKKNL